MTELLALSLSPLMKAAQTWWLSQVERHNLICADMEQQRAYEALRNAAHYQKMAALARSNRAST